MSGLDLFLLVVIGLGVWRGIRTGALTQLVGAFGMVLDFLVGIALMDPVGEIVTASLGVSPRTAPVMGFIVSFGAVVLGLLAAARAVRATLNAIKLGGLDTAAGAGVGGLRSAFNLSLLLLVTSASPIPGSQPLFISAETRDASVIYPAVQAIAPTLWDVGRAVTPGIQEALMNKFNAWNTPSDSTDAPPFNDEPLDDLPREP